MNKPRGPCYQRRRVCPGGLLRLLCDKPGLDGRPLTGYWTEQRRGHAAFPTSRAACIPPRCRGLSWEGPAGPGWLNPASLGIQRGKGLTPAAIRRQRALWFYVGLSHFVQLEALGGLGKDWGKGIETDGIREIGTGSPGLGVERAIACVCGADCGSVGQALVLAIKRARTHDTPRLACWP